MVTAPSRYVWSLVGTLAFAAFAGAAELTTDAERSHRELRYSSDVARKVLAERWYGLVRLQEWTNETGQFKTRAKYVEHDPAMAWVKLRVIQGTGDERVVKDIEVPIEKLSKTCQSRVRQIAFLTQKVSAAVAAEQEAAADEDAGRETGETFGRGGDLRGGPGRETDEADFSDAALGRRTDGRGDPRLNTREATRRQPPTRSVGRGGPLPAMLPPLPGSVLPSSTSDSGMVAREAVTAAAEPAESAGPVLPPKLTDDDPWRTNYEIFRANFVYSRDGSLELRQRWAGVARMQDLVAIDQQSRARVAERSGRPAEDDSFSPVTLDFSEGLGDFVWEATISLPVGSDANWTDVLSLPPLPEPLKIEFRLDDQGAGDWRQLQVGDRVRFIGRLAGFAGENVMVAAIRFPTANQRAENAGPPVDALEEDDSVDHDTTRLREAPRR